MLPRRGSFVLILVLLALTLFPAPAQADSAPPPPPSGSNPAPGEEQTQVRMVAETVTVKIAGQSAYIHGHAKVTASFQMRNLGSAEEKMKARFPLNTVYDTGPNQFECWSSGYPPINDMAVRVDGKPVAIRTEMAQVQNFNRVSPNDPELVDAPCWGHFWVNFPPGQDVRIDVTYTAQGGEGKFSPNWRYQPYYYILQTGAGWNDTIGKADIIVQAPFDLNEENFLYAYPEGYSRTNGNELRWHFENVEPTYGENINVAIMEPNLWSEILTARQGVKNAPQSATAWARLAAADHKAVLLGYPYDDSKEEIPLGGMLRSSLFESAGSTTLANEARQAYEKVIEYQPKNVDLRLRYAKLLFAFWSRGDDPSFYQSEILGAVQMIQAALKIDPNNKQAKAMLEYIANMPWTDNHTMIDLSQHTPVYYFLTPLPTYTPTFTPEATRLPDIPPSETPTAPAVRTKTAAVVAAVKATPILSDRKAAAVPTDVYQEPQPEPAPRVNPWLWAGVGVVLAGLVFGLVTRRRR